VFTICASGAVVDIDWNREGSQVGIPAGMNLFELVEGSFTVSLWPFRYRPYSRVLYGRAETTKNPSPFGFGSGRGRPTFNCSIGFDPSQL
jgi:hypothetical protein